MLGAHGTTPTECIVGHPRFGHATILEVRSSHSSVLEQRSLCDARPRMGAPSHQPTPHATSFRSLIYATLAPSFATADSGGVRTVLRNQMSESTAHKIEFPRAYCPVK